MLNELNIVNLFRYSYFFGVAMPKINELQNLCTKHFDLLAVNNRRAKIICFSGFYIYRVCIIMRGYSMSVVISLNQSTVISIDTNDISFQKKRKINHQCGGRYI